jgi:hypothetical protein
MAVMQDLEALLHEINLVSPAALACKCIILHNTHMFCWISRLVTIIPENEENILTAISNQGKA